MDRRHAFRFLRRVFLFFALFSLPIVIELVVLPPDYFTFRLWEALKVNKYEAYFSGPFYPNVSLCKEEEGDLAHHTQFAQKRPACWTIDRWGYRTEPSNTSYWPVVVIGDSFIVGSGSSQEETFSTHLRHLVQKPVYPLAPATITTFLSDPRFLETPPEYVILESVERDILSLAPYPQKPLATPAWIAFSWLQRPFVQTILAGADRRDKKILHTALYQNLIRLTAGRTPRGVAATKKGVFFLQGEAANIPVADPEIERIVAVLREYDRQFRMRGIDFLFLPIPNKESIYFDVFPQKIGSTFLPELISRLREAEVAVIDTYTLFEHAYRTEQVQLYYPDDTHWNVEGTIRTARACADSIFHQATTEVQ